MALIEVGGIQGVGKSTLINGAKLYTANSFEVVKRSIILSEILGVPAGKEHEVPKAEFEAAHNKMRSMLGAINKCVRDTHFSSFEPTPKVYPIEKEDIGRVAVTVLVSASTISIAKRRASGARLRSTETLVIEQQLELEERAANQTAMALGVPLIKITNEDYANSSMQLAEIIDTYI